MKTEHLVKMVNQIELFFRSEPNRETAIAGIAGHLRRYWEPRMRREIVAHLAQGGSGLGELAREAVRRMSA
ncbi:MAG: formate dehydrogenase subunit delta [Gammaproteobacteria bacterium]|nr:formate dehydrogenase subunit delta [Gammaproteobacteria bacterium]